MYINFDKCEQLCKRLPEPFTGDYDLQSMVERTYKRILFKTWVVGYKPSSLKYSSDTIYLFKDGIEGNGKRKITIEEWETLISKVKKLGKNYLLVTEEWLKKESKRYCSKCGHRL